MELKGKTLNEFLDNVEVVGKATATMFKFQAKEIKKGDVTRFINLWKKLKVNAEIIYFKKKIKGEKVDVIIVDEKAKLPKKLFLTSTPKGWEKYDVEEQKKARKLALKILKEEKWKK